PVSPLFKQFVAMLFDDAGEFLQNVVRRISSVPLRHATSLQSSIVQIGRIRRKPQICRITWEPNITSHLECILFQHLRWARSKTGVSFSLASGGTVWNRCILKGRDTDSKRQ